MKKLLLFLFIFNLASCANTRLVVPLVTTHVQKTNIIYNNENYGAGIEFKKGDMSYGITYIKENSYYEPSIYLNANKRFNIKKRLYFIGGGFVANGYEELTSYKIVAAPVMGFEYYNFRLVTTYPTGQLLCSTYNCADFVNLSWFHEFQ